MGYLACVALADRIRRDNAKALAKVIRDRMKLKPGDRLDVSTDGDRIVMTPSILDIDDLFKVLPPPNRVATLDEIDSAIRRRAVRGQR